MRSLLLFSRHIGGCILRPSVAVVQAAVWPSVCKFVVRGVHLRRPCVVFAWGNGLWVMGCSSCSVE